MILADLFKSADSVQELAYVLDSPPLAVTDDVNPGFFLESELQKKLVGSPNQVEAVRANLEKRAPVFEDPE